jgi:hypothetical protein
MARHARQVWCGLMGWVRRWWVRKIIRFWQKRSLNCDFSVLHSPSTLSTPKNIWRVDPSWGVRRTRFRWEKFSIVFAPYSIDLVEHQCITFDARVSDASSTGIVRRHFCSSHARIYTHCFDISYGNRTPTLLLVSCTYIYPLLRFNSY